jgi:S1-C subfamily serine protease
MRIIILPTLLVLLLISSRAQAQDDLIAAEEQALQAAVERVAPSVVRIETVGGLERVRKVLVGTGPTTGLVVSNDGYIISSAFNFVQQPSSILVTLPGGARAAAKIVARDQSRMLVLLKVETTEKLTVPQAVPRSEMRVGQWAVAVGRTFEPTEPAVSVGVVSALNRVWSKALQTDAKISPNNYGGPLIDVHGRVFGVLVPLSPQETGDLAGTEWYDSGIGFAVPLDDIFKHLDQLKLGKDLHPGLLGVSLKQGDIYSLPAEVAAAPPNSPANKAGVKPGDVIVEIDGQTISRQAQLKHAMGPHYAGEQVKLVLNRGDQRIDATLELAEKLEPYAHPFLGLLPMRDGAKDAEGVVVRYVFPGSPAAEAGIKAGDKLVSIAGKPAGDAAGLQETAAGLDPKLKAAVKIQRGEETLDLELMPTQLPTTIAAELPPAVARALAAPPQPPATGLVEIKLAEEKNECWVVVPENYHPEVPHALVTWLHGVDGVDKDKLLSRWKELAAKHQLIVVAPRSSDGKKWEATDNELVRKVIDDALGRFNIDRTRLVVFGEQAGGSMAWLVGLQQIERIRGIAVTDAIPPPRVKLPENDPVRRLAIYTAVAEKSPLAAVMKVLTGRLGTMKYPVTTRELGEKPRDLSDEETAELARWIDQLDRI